MFSSKFWTLPNQEIPVRKNSFSWLNPFCKVYINFSIKNSYKFTKKILAIQPTVHSEVSRGSEGNQRLYPV